MGKSELPIRSTNEKQPKLRRVNRPLVGTQKTSSLHVVPKKQLSHIHVSRLSPETTELELKNFIQQYTQDVSCEKLNSQRPDVYSSLKITLPRDLHETVMDPAFWPEGVAVTNFFMKRRQPTMKRNLKIIQLNVQGINDKFNYLDVIISIENPDILSIAEVWSSPDQVSFLAINGYYIAASYCRSLHQRGGTAIYVKSDYLAENIKQIEGFSFELQCELCAINLKVSTKNVSIISVYRPPGANTEFFVDSLSCALDCCFARSDLIFVCGNFNINYFAPHNYLDYLLLRYNLKITSTEPTRIFTDRNGKTSSSKIDYILTNASTDFLSVGVFESNIADHKAIRLIFNYNTDVETTKPVLRSFRLLKNENLQILSEMAASTCFDSVYSFTDVDGAFEEFLNIFYFLG
ncbi:uncharacterized protein LOC123314388 [Coccinella septempunctata]|uniref:uncharacterized protein LOC123314388 n=1 Tax=Coccinella septempunctata TaxID=41139 RepID=UPI001D072EF4|nr:uncharacterized protein LOC123314388 [Coccinella septempunctata]